MNQVKAVSSCYRPFPTPEARTYVPPSIYVTMMFILTFTHTHTHTKLVLTNFVLSAFFESQSLGTSIVRLRNIASGRFLAINSKGRIITQV